MGAAADKHLEVSGALSDVAFPKMYEAELGYVWKTMIRLGVLDADAADLAHEAFLVAFRTREQYDPARPLRPWLFAIAARLAANSRRLSRHAREQPTEELHRSPASTGDPERAFAAQQDRELVLRALDRLSEEQRTAFVM